ncbi:hypothetical protein F5148DRAFT_1369175 [Russula earlei]|uniref:Uncharacterized protein n=1 Tax=Russula earlei TaxID=71964 RepID=A0ACC0U3U3_9AGAM|nr:hypothetical protein F5148DRAFT_1369175 [Russula earlei]
MHPSTVFAILCLAIGVAPSFAILSPRSGKPSTSRPGKPSTSKPQQGASGKPKHVVKPLPILDDNRYDDVDVTVKTPSPMAPTGKFSHQEHSVTYPSDPGSSYKYVDIPLPKAPSPVGSPKPARNVEPDSNYVPVEKAASEIEVSKKDTPPPRPQTAPS